MKTKKKNSGVELWNKAKKIIPGGNQLLSKRAEMFLPDAWPAYYKKAKGIEIWDLDNNKYKDMSIMGIGSCILGYANKEVNNAVKDAVDRGSMSTLNCHEEVELTEKLIELHDWANMVRFSRTGGEACAIAIRIARAASGKDKVAFVDITVGMTGICLQILLMKKILMDRFCRGLNLREFPEGSKAPLYRLATEKQMNWIQ
jgi:glutamate-1-semialdehyde 2,1-aminomutase